MPVPMWKVGWGEATGRSLFAHWWVGRDRETPWHLQRLFWMSFDRVFHNVAHHWAYFSLATPARGPTDDPPASAALRPSFAAELYPNMRL
jgi:hypothetical protein